MMKTWAGQPTATANPPKVVGGLRHRGIVSASKPGRPLISIVSVVLNGARHIRECIDSVLAQSYSNFEHVIVDGGSTDGTLEILRSYDDRIAYWESGRDRGIYDAMNRGLRRVTGDVVGVVGSDDALYPDALAAVASAFATFPEIDYTYGAVDLVRGTGEVFGRSLPIEQVAFEATPYNDMPFCHLSLFLRTEVHRRLGEYDLAYPVRADYDLVLRMLERGCSGMSLEPVIGRYRVGGTSDALSTCFETRRLVRRHGAPRLRSEWRFISSLAKVWAVSVLPPSLATRLKRFIPSRHVFF
jgi:glycosyltransferase involved in cell wall biosynthesis